MGEIPNINKIDHQVLSIIKVNFVNKNRSNPVPIYFDDFYAENLNTKDVLSSLDRLQRKRAIKSFDYGSGEVVKENGKYIPELHTHDLYETDELEERLMVAVNVDESEILAREGLHAKNADYIFTKEGQIIFRDKVKDLFEKDTDRFLMFKALIEARGDVVSPKSLMDIGGKTELKDVYREIPRMEERLAEVLDMTHQRGNLIENVSGAGYRLIIDIVLQKDK